MRENLTSPQQAIESLLSKSDMSKKHQALIKDALTKAQDIKQDIMKIMNETTMLPQKEQAAKDAIDNINDVITDIIVVAARTNISLSLSTDTGRYFIKRNETDVMDEINSLTQ